MSRLLKHTVNAANLGGTGVLTTNTELVIIQGVNDPVDRTTNASRVRAGSIVKQVVLQIDHTLSSDTAGFGGISQPYYYTVGFRSSGQAVTDMPVTYLVGYHPLRTNIVHEDMFMFIYSGTDSGDGTNLSYSQRIVINIPPIWQKIQEGDIMFFHYAASLAGPAAVHNDIALQAIFKELEP